MATLVLFSLFMFGLAFVVANRRTTKPALTLPSLLC